MTFIAHLYKGGLITKSKVLDVTTDLLGVDLKMFSARNVNLVDML